MGTDAFPARHERDEAEGSQHHDDRIETGALPVAAAEVKPHSKFIKRKRHRKPVEQGPEAASFAWPRCEKKNGGGEREKKDSVIEMMHVGSAGVEEQVRHSARHDEDHADA